MRLFALFALISAALAQQAPEAPKKARIEGNVVSSTGQPIPRAQIRLQGLLTAQAIQVTQPAVYTTTSDDAGKFAIEEIDPGRNFQLTAQRPGFVPARYGARSATSGAAPLALEAGQALKGISIVMTPQAVISGKVTDANGDPVQNTQIVVQRRGYQRGVRTLLASGSASTNDQGEYRVANLTPGRYFLLAMDRQVANTTAGVAPAEGPLATFYPNATDAQSAAPIDVTAGQEVRGVDIRLRKGRMFSVRGKVLGASAAPGAQTVLMIQPKTESANSPMDSALRRQTQVRPDGTFELRGLVSGTYTLQAISATAAFRGSAGRMDLTVVDKDLADVTFSLTPGATVTGTVRVEDGDIKNLLPAPAATTATPSAGAARVAVSLTELVAGPIPGTQPAPLKDDGAFTLEGASPSKFQLNVLSLPAGYYVKSANFGGTDAIRNPVDLTSGAGGSLNIVLSNKAADINGIVRSDKDESLTGVIITLWSRDPEAGTAANGVRTAVADMNGAFQFQGLRPGVYYAAAWEDIDIGLAQARDFLTLLTTEATKIELADGAHSAIEVKMIPAAKIRAAEEKLP